MSYYKYRKLPDFSKGKRANGSKFFMDIIRKSQLFCSPYMNLNDPSEWFFESSLELSQEKLDGLKDKTRICCLSSTCISNLMWCMYGDDHKGCCFEVEVVDNNAKKMEVDYSNKVSTINNINDLDIALIHKTTDWEHEQETRYLKYTGKADCNIFLKVKIKSIIFGCRVNDETKNKVRELVHKKLPDVKFYQINREIFTHETSNIKFVCAEDLTRSYLSEISMNNNLQFV